MKRAFVDNWVVERINKERPKVEFKIWMLARVSFKAGSWRMRVRHLRVFCSYLMVAVVHNNVLKTLSKPFESFL